MYSDFRAWKPTTAASGTCGAARLAFGVGIFGQNVFADPENGIVVAKMSSQAPPLDERLIALTMRGVEAIRRRLSGE